MGLAVKDGNLIQLGCDFEQVLQRANPGHTVANHHQFRGVHNTDVSFASQSPTQRKEIST